MRSLEGQFSTQVHQLADDVISLRVYIEAALDFAEEEIDFLADSPINDRLQHCRTNLEKILKQAEAGRVLNEGLALTLAGLPNAGKSSLLNYFAGYEAAIVTEVAGTTRDVLREHISLNGIPLHVHDTAGLRESDNPVEKEGVKRAWQEIHKADTVLLLVDATIGLSAAHAAIIERLQSNNYHLVYTKSDLLPEAAAKDPDALYISVLSGEGMEALIDVITGNFSNFSQDDQSIMARRRHVEALRSARDNLLQAQEIFQKTQSGELVAEDLRLAQQHLNEITGEFTSDDLLGDIFSKFCIGK
jgi:tRNA modification GTPase